MRLGHPRRDGSPGSDSRWPSRRAGSEAAAAAQECGTYSGSGCAPDSRRVDLATPSFSDPTRVVNPLFPISELHSAVLLGREQGQRFRSETTLLAGTRTVVWNGRRIPVLVSQYIAWRRGRLVEVALDRYAQANDGSVWYFSEARRLRARPRLTTEGHGWRSAGRGDHPAARPTHRRVSGPRRRRIVFEEVTVKAVGRIGAAATRSPAHRRREQRLRTESQQLAAGSGEFSTGAERTWRRWRSRRRPTRSRRRCQRRSSGLTTGAAGMLA